MKIGIDISPISKDKAGIGYFTESLIKALQEIDAENSYELFTAEEKPNLNFKLNINFKLRYIPYSSPNTVWMLKGAKQLRQERFDYFISTSNFLWSIIFSKTIQIVHDIAPIKYPQFFNRKARIAYPILLHLALLRADKILTISKTVRKELISLNRNVKIDFMPLGVHEWVNSKNNNEYYQKIREKYSLPEKYFVSISTLEPRKNHINMIRGFAKFKKGSSKNRDASNFKLVIVGKNGWYFKDIYKVVEELNIKDSIIFTGYAPEEDLAGLLDQSSGSTMLSFYEGFGLPILESLIRNKCVLASEIPVFKEITKGSQNVHFVNPLDTNDISNGFTFLSKMKFVSEKIGLSEYNWHNSALKVRSLLSP